VWEWKNADAFGNNLPDENPTGLATAFKYHLRFPGQYFDQETGTHYYYFRDYDPAIGRYVQSDPIGLMGGEVTYGYVFNSPITMVDPSGLAPSTGPMPNQKTLLQCPEPCEVISQSISEALSALKKAWVHMYYDVGNQYVNARYKPLPGTKTSWEGHKQNYYNIRNQLRNQIHLARKFKCAINPEAERWSLYSHPPLAPYEVDPGWTPPF
jgi:RHS repeat-associated protein